MTHTLYRPRRAAEPPALKRLFLVLVTILALAPPARAQEDDARAYIAEGLALAAGGDTATALARLEQAVEAAPDMAEAHYQLGRLLARHASSDEFDFRERLAAEKALLRALELEPADPEYMAELGRFRMKQNRQVEGALILGRALKKAKEQGSANNAVMAEIEFGLGYRKELEYERLRDRRILPATVEPISITVPPNRGVIITDAGFMAASNRLSRYVRDYLQRAPPLKRSGRATRERAIRHYRAALRYDPTHYEASRRLLPLLLEDGQLDEYRATAERLVESHPDRPQALLYLGLGLHRLGREDAAQAAFDRALARMTEEERAPFLTPEQVMRRKPAEAYLELDDTSRARFEQTYWRLSDPLYLTEANEVRLEHMARVAYADLRFAEPAAGLRGWETDRGITYIRYGPPTEIARVQRRIRDGAASTIIWVYGDGGPVFMFRQNPGFFHAPFAGDYEWVAREARYLQPAAYRNIPALPVLLEIPVQLARFRGDSPQEVAVEIHSELPLDSLARDLDLESGEIETGLFLLDLEGTELVRRVATRVLEYADASTRNDLRSWRLILPPSDKLVAAVEARDATTWRAAAARDTFTVEPFPDDSLSVSDILLADALRPLAADPVRRTDFDITPNPGRVYAPQQPVVIYYELYGLERDREGFASYEVSLAVKIKALDREGTLLGGDRNPLQIIGLLADAWGFSPVGDDRLELRFSRELDMRGRDRATEYHSLDLREAPPGEYEITLKIWDGLGKRLAQRTRKFTVTRDE
jgi:GWxTD domain-containing protein